MNEPLVSIIIPVFNSGVHLEETIQSALKQTYKNLEIIAVNDGSIDNSFEILKTHHGKIKIINSVNMGAAHARNLGIKASHGEILAFMDSDDLWEPTKIEKQVLKMVNEGLDLVYCSGREFGNFQKNFTRHRARFAGDCYKYFVSYPTRAIIVLGCSSALIKKEKLDKSGLFDENFKGPAEDWDFFRRVCKFANVGFVDEDLVCYRIHGGNVSKSSAFSYFDGNKMAIKKMLSEDNSIQRANVWTRFYLVFMKESIKTRNFGLLRRTIASLFRFSD